MQFVGSSYDGIMPETADSLFLFFFWDGCNFLGHSELMLSGHGRKHVQTGKKQ